MRPVRSAHPQLMELWCGAPRTALPDADPTARPALDVGVESITIVLRAGVPADDWIGAVQALLNAAIPPGHLALRTARPLSPDELAALVALVARSAARGVTCSAEFILEDDADAIAWLGQLPSSLRDVVTGTRALREQGVPVRWWLPLSPTLVHRLEALYSLARREGVDPVVVAAGVGGAVAVDRDSLALTDDRLFAADFVAHRLLDRELTTLSETRRRAYAALLASLRAPAIGGRLSTHRVRVLHYTGAAGTGQWPAHDERREGLGIPPEDRAGPLRTLDGSGIRWRLAHAVDVVSVLTGAARGVVAWLLAQLTRRPNARPDRLPRLLLIGAYGGDHIGDTAILGGVLLRMHARYGTTHAVLMSQRPEHTRHLVEMLETPIQVTVERYHHGTVAAAVRRVDGVVFAGGPLMDLPKQLVLHLYTVSLARRRKKPFHVEGIGAGPFFRGASEWIAGRLLRMADRIVVRTSSDAAAPLMAGLAPETSRDPAFDYIAMRGHVLTRQTPADARWLEQLLRGTEGRLIVGVNVRPIRHEFTSGAEVGQQLQYTRMIATRFEERLADAMRQCHAAVPRPVTFLFFPMNAIQFGMSDLESAFRIKQLLGADADFRVWEGDASLDGVLALLRRMDAVIAMRFHAAVFALSQQRRVFGVDYRIGKSYKVTALLRDAGRGEDCTRIDEMTVEWLVERLMDAAATSDRLHPRDTASRDD